MKGEKDDGKAADGRKRERTACEETMAGGGFQGGMRPYLILGADKRAARSRLVLRQEPQKPHLSLSLALLVVI